METERLPIQVGQIKANVIAALGLSIAENTPILLGKSNIQHMKNDHPEDYVKYGAYIGDILDSPDYVGINPGDNSIEYVKEFEIDNDFVKVAVRVSRKGTLFARTIYTLNPNRTQNFIAAGTLKKP